MTAAPVFALIDCNAFYVSCERLFDAHLRGRAVSLRRPMKHLTPILRQGSGVAKQVWDRVGHGRLLHRRLTTSEAVRRSDGNGGDLIIELPVVGGGPAVRGLRTVEGVARHFGADCDAIGHLVL